MKFFGSRVFRSRRRKQKPVDVAYEELDEQGMRDLEATISQHSAFIVLRGEKLQRYEERMAELTRALTRTAVLPPMRQSSAKTILKRNPDVIPRQQMHSQTEGPSISMDSAHDFSHHVFGGKEDLSASSRSENMPEDINVHEDVQEPVDVPELVSVGSKILGENPLVSKEGSKIQDLESEHSDEAIPAALLSDSTHGDYAVPDTATTGDTYRLNDIHDWKQYQQMVSFADFNQPPPMKVHSFLDLETQCLSPSRIDTGQSPIPRTPEKDLGMTDGLLFAVDSFELQSARESTAASSTEVDPE